MSNFKSLILGSAATLVAFAGAQAADLPVKAKAVQYVKICSLYGAGFYYIPGTDTCLKIGGYVAGEYDFDARGSETQKYSGAAGLNTRDNDDVFFRGRTNVTFDTRTATEYGVVRTFYQHDIHFSTGTTAANLGTPNSSTWSGTIIGTAFVQFAGFTFGKAIPLLTSQFVMPRNSSSLFGYSDAGAPNIGIVQAAYTFDLGNGLSISAGVEDSSSRQPLYDANLAIQSPFVNVPTFANNSYGGQTLPDFVANIKFDQAWGSLFGAVKVRDLRMTYYAGTASVGSAAAAATTTLLESTGHADDVAAWGFVGGFQLKNIPTGAGDNFTVLGSYGDGLTTVSSNADPVSPLIGLRGFNANGGTGSLGLGYILDGVTAPGTSIQKTKSYGVQAGFEHYWVPGKLRTSLFGSYAEFDYNDTAKGLLCNAAKRGAALLLSATSNCDFDIKISQIGSRSVWTPVSGLDIQAEVLYTHFDLPLTGTIQNVGTGGAANGFQAPAGSVYTLGNQNAMSGQFRVIRTF